MRHQQRARTHTLNSAPHAAEEAPETAHLTGDSATSVLPSERSAAMLPDKQHAPSSFGLFFKLPVPSWPHLFEPNAYESPEASTTMVCDCRIAT
jgi:hypothetical protein